MGDYRFSSESGYGPQRSGAGTITRVRLENFMCHSSLQIELGEWVNFITGQNGSGKSAILTALCIAFGCRAKGTQRAATLKDFIKTGCSYAMVEVELKNRGEDAFKPEIFGDSIIIGRRITESTSTTVLKDHQGKRVASRKQELLELIDHFNIDVENPCVIMSQDKSREFLHSGNDKDKFKFFFKATLLQQVNDLLQSIYNHLNKGDALVLELEATIKPTEKELSELQRKIRNMEHVEEITQDLQRLKKKLAWSWVYDVDRQLKEQNLKIEKLKDRIPRCQAKIDSRHSILESLRDCFMKKKAEIAVMVEKTSEVRRRKDELQQSISLATKEKLELEGELVRNTSYMQKMVNRVKGLEQQVHDIQEQHVRNTQAEESEIEAKLKELQCEIDAANITLSRMKEEDSALSEKLSKEKNEIRRISDEIEDYDKKCREIRSEIRELQQHQTNKVTAFGGDRVISLLRAIERHHHKFKSPPIGPIGSHVTLVNGDTWAPAVEQAIGRLLNAFIVTDHKDALLLRGCAREANYNHLQIIIYDFSRPRLSLPHHMLPHTKHPTTLSVLQSDNPTVINVLVDMGSAERQVLVRDYDVGKAVAFEQRISNLKEVYTLDGHKMFSRGSVQTILPLNRRIRTGRLCGSYDEKIKDLERAALHVQEEAQQCRKRKRDSEERLQDLQQHQQNVKRRCFSAERNRMSKELAFQDVKNSFAADAGPPSASAVDEISQEISNIQEEIQEKEIILEKLQFSMNEAEAKVEDLKLSFQSLCESAKEEVDTFEAAEKELMEIEKNLQTSESEKAHYEDVMRTRVVGAIKEAESQYRELELLRQDSCRKASVICPESEIEALGGWDGSTPEQLSAQVNRLNQRLKHESHQYSESIEDLRMLYEEKEHKILRKQQTYQAFREKVRACREALDSRWGKFQRNATLLKRQLTWQFNGHLGKKGISGKININYEEKTLSIEVKMPQDASSSNVRDTRGLSGGERSFSTLCFALALHEMTEAPFRAMDEFDVFMDAISRKISLDTLVDFALAQGSQWIFITPHDVRAPAWAKVLPVSCERVVMETANFSIFQSKPAMGSLDCIECSFDTVLCPLSCMANSNVQLFSRAQQPFK
ncbi:Structural maintenance of chromosomes protein 6B [Citrus sinensis]|uniref:Structural maintenance of chromosomes protein 6B n=1 Tax=Citrus sinensis TaxID=2711 RepID=A0ACB8HW42_CITSI|nr:Structural maintenance of chromosomes protein 6B [Citrus sinensis]